MCISGKGFSTTILIPSRTFFFFFLLLPDLVRTPIHRPLLVTPHQFALDTLSGQSKWTKLYLTFVAHRRNYTCGTCGQCLPTAAPTTASDAQQHTQKRRRAAVEKSRSDRENSRNNKKKKPTKKREREREAMAKGALAPPTAHVMPSNELTTFRPGRARTPLVIVAPAERARLSSLLREQSLLLLLVVTTSLFILCARVSQRKELINMFPRAQREQAPRRFPLPNDGGGGTKMDSGAQVAPCSCWLRDARRKTSLASKVEWVVMC